MNKNVKQAVVISYNAVGKPTRKEIPGSWKKAAGMMKHHARGLERYISRVRKEWR